MSKTQTVAATAVAAPEQIQQIALNRLQPSPDNPRTTFDETTLAELADSIRSIGIQVPLLVRRNLDGSEIIAGHRRFRAAAIAGLTEVPCIVREMDDKAAREIMVVENLQRDDLPPMEEAEAYAALRQLLGSTQAIAARVGKPIAYVTRRLQLNSLGLHPRDALRAQLITIDHALLLAKLGLDEQNSNLKWALDHTAGMKVPVDTVIANATKRHNDEKKSRWAAWEPQSVAKLKNHIEQHTGRKLHTAPWDLAATTLDPEGVACLGCPSNTDDNRALFSDMSIDEATCANGACWAVKQDTFIHIQMASVGDKALRLSWKSSEAEPRMDAATNRVSEKQVLKQGQWIRARAGSCGNLRKGVTVDFEESRFGDSGKGKPGEIVQVCIMPKCKAHPKSYETREKRSNGNHYDPVAEQKKREANAIAVAAENKIRLELAQRAIAKVDKLPIEPLRMLLTSHVHGLPAAILKDLRTAPITGATFARAIAMFALYESSLELRDYNSPDDEREEFLSTLKMLGVDGKSAWEKKPEPKVAKATTKEATPGTCRYCGRTDDNACPGGCCWVDPQETVCSSDACVEKYEAANRTLPKVKAAKATKPAAAKKGQWAPAAKLDKAARARIVEATRKHWAKNKGGAR